MLKNNKKRYDWYAHHLITAQSGDQKNELDKRLIRSVDNCLYLCFTCHLEYGHGGDYIEGGIVEPRDYARYFPYVFGMRGSSQLTIWAHHMAGHFERILSNAPKVIEQRKEAKAKQKK